MRCTPKLICKVCNNSLAISSIVLIAYTLINKDLFLMSLDRVGARLHNAVNHPLNESWPWITGLTSADPLGSGNYYFIEILPYLHNIAAHILLGPEISTFAQRYIDIAVILGSAAIFSKLCASILGAKKIISKMIIKISVTLCLIFSPWTAYLIYRVDWYEPLFMLTLVTSMNLLVNRRFWAGSVTLAIAFILRYQYAFFIAIYFIMSEAYSRNKTNNSFWSIPEIVKKKLPIKWQRMAWCSIGLWIWPILELRRYIAERIIGDALQASGGTSVLSRIGIDGNFHSGGLLGSIQFLGGYKWTMCFAISDISQKTITSLAKPQILKAINCQITHLSLIAISLIAILGIILYFTRSNKSKLQNGHQWTIAMLCFMFSSMLLTFQQSYTVHIQGYSYVWAFIFAFGLTNFFRVVLMQRSWPWKIVAVLVFGSMCNTLALGSFNVGERLAIG